MSINTAAYEYDERMAEAAMVSQEQLEEHMAFIIKEMINSEEGRDELLKYFDLGDLLMKTIGDQLPQSFPLEAEWLAARGFTAKSAQAFIAEVERDARDAMS